MSRAVTELPVVYRIILSRKWLEWIRTHHNARIVAGGMMSEYPFPADIAALIHEHMVLGGYSSEADVLRDALQALSQRNADIETIQQGITDFEAGRVRPLADVADEIRKRHQWTN